VPARRNLIVSAMAVSSQSSELHQELRLKRVTLYKNNLGFYERSGNFEPDSSRTHVFYLRVPRDRRNLVVETLTTGGGARGATVRVAESTTTSDANHSKPLDVGSFKYDSLETFLSSCKGVEVSLLVEGKKPLSGRILMVDRVMKAVPDETKKAITKSLLTCVSS